MPEIELRDQPRPNDHLDGGTVIASVVLTDDEEPTTWVVLLLRRSAPFYGVVEVNEYGEVTDLGEASNIVPAVESYKDNGGDY